MQPKTLTNQQLDRRRCFICFEAITGPMCSRCGHLHDLRQHPDYRAILAFARAHAAAVKRLAEERRTRGCSGSQPEGFDDPKA